ncbi:MAG: alpha-ketoglutarate-dependent dioxygenase AlkB [Flavobacteriaceae bacterium]|nr:alpha-ketoglutarate-dependent dioxygenase AlkB [Flavobacteriaceae bacterium]
MYNLDSYIQEAKEIPVKLPLDDAEIFYYPNFISKKTADTYFQKLRKDTQWQQDVITVFGKTHPQPRLTALFGADRKTYTYSGITMYPTPFTKILLYIKESVVQVCNSNFNTVLLNLYRSGSDSNGWHSDDEKELGKNPVIASVSFGVERFFQLKNKKDTSLTYKLTLHHGSLLLMKGKTQHFWHHQIPKTKAPINERINLTFRNIV